MILADGADATNPLHNPLVIVAIIGFAQAVTLALLGWLLAKTRQVKKDTAATAGQIVNHHPEQPNFREENDRRHEETRKWFMTIYNKTARLERSFNARLDHVSQLANDLLEGFLENRERIENIEETNGGRKNPNE